MLFSICILSDVKNKLMFFSAVVGKIQLNPANFPLVKKGRKDNKTDKFAGNNEQI